LAKKFLTTAKQMLEKPIDVNQTFPVNQHVTQQEGLTPLAFAIQLQYAEICKVLLQHPRMDVHQK
jgi:hypothetical protein